VRFGNDARKVHVVERIAARPFVLPGRNHGGENDSKPIKVSKRCDSADARTRFPFAVPFAWSTLSRLIRARLLP